MMHPASHILTRLGIDAHLQVDYVPTVFIVWFSHGMPEPEYVDRYCLLDDMQYEDLVQIMAEEAPHYYDEIIIGELE